MPEAKLQLIPLGGLGEFGMNCMVLRYGDDMIVIDAGMMFPEAELLGVDIVTPDFTYLEQNRECLRAVILTHGHEDHIGGVPFLFSQLKVPIYGTPFTLALVERRLEEHELLKEAELHEVKPQQRITIGPFSIEFINVTHSIVSAVALAITTPLGVVIHTGDFKVDPRRPTTCCSTCTRWPNTASAASCCCCPIPRTSIAPATQRANAPSGRGSKTCSFEPNDG
jgi:ribonuclease J